MSRADPGILLSAEGHFREMLQEALEKRKIKTYPQVENYLVWVLEHHLDSRNLFNWDITFESQERPKTTFAEMYLTAINAPMPHRLDLLKQIGDRSLYFCGFFGDSLQRKILDVGYYIEMGERAYSNLSSMTREDMSARVYQVISDQFVDFVDVLEYISQKSQARGNQDVLRLYEKYLRTGSDLARDQLIEMGVLTPHRDQLKVKV